jgi:Ran GTPase-activating protein (RanGAP) involved in mRNA processing and transport
MPEWWNEAADGAYGRDDNHFEMEMSGVTALANTIKDMRALTILDVSKNNLGWCDVLPKGWSLHPGNGGHARYIHTDGTRAAEDSPPAGGKSSVVIALATSIKDMGALSVVNIMGNAISKEQLSKLQEIMRSKPNLISLCGIADDATEVDLSGLGMDADDAIILASELPDKRAMIFFDISSNDIKAEGSKALAAVLKGNQVITELNFSNNNLGDNSVGESDTSGVIAIADAIPDMGALSTLILSQNGIIKREVGTVLADILKANTVLTNLDISYCADYTAGPDSAGFARELAVGIKDNKALTSLHVGKNNIPEKEMKEIMAIAMRMDSIKALCEVPFKDKTLTELDVSGKNLGMEGVLLVAEYLDGNGALSVLNLAETNLWELILKGWKAGQRTTTKMTSRCTGILMAESRWTTQANLRVLSLLPMPSLIWRPYHQ